jgi:hypothetical protein
MKHRLGLDFFNAEESIYSGDPFDLYNWLRNTDTPVEKAFRYPGIGNILIPGIKKPDFVQDYERFKEKNNKVDFSDQIQIVRNEKIELDTPVLMIDEVQDLTRQQIEVVRMWEPKLEIMIIAGGPLQSIYGYLGGTPEFYMNWGAEEKILPRSYRLVKPIWEIACGILKLEGMQPPTKEPRGLGNPEAVNFCRYSEITPGFGCSELHLVRCNFQAIAIAMDLASLKSLFKEYTISPEKVPSSGQRRVYFQRMEGLMPAINSFFCAYPFGSPFFDTCTPRDASPNRDMEPSELRSKDDQENLCDRPFCRRKF